MIVGRHLCLQPHPASHQHIAMCQSKRGCTSAIGAMQQLHIAKMVLQRSKQGLCLILPLVHRQQTDLGGREGGDSGI